jgi:membrane-bound ClpP family serine protease
MKLSNIIIAAIGFGLVIISVFDPAFNGPDLIGLLLLIVAFVKHALEDSENE